ncbi:hypothetical protein II906_09645, partial [bacterium]|nr:hypothetical protein [bacterium]
IINIDIVEGKSYKIVDIINEAIKNNEQNNQVEQEVQAPAFDISKIKVKVPQVKISDYALNINDLQTSNSLKIRGNELALGYFNGKRATAKTIAELFVNDKKNINADINIDTFIPEITEETTKQEASAKEEMPFINPVAIYMTYDLKADIASKIKIRNSKKQNRIVSNGYFNVDKITMNLSGLQLPESKMHLITNGTKAVFDTDLYIAKDQNISINGNLDYGTKPNADIEIKSDDIQVNDILTLAKAAINSLNIKNDLAQYKGEGSFNLNTKFKSDLKKINSNGQIAFKNCIIKDAKSVLAKINSVISLENNNLKFVDTTLEVVDTKFTIDGTINEKAVADIALIMEKLPLEKVFKMALPADMNKAYDVKAGTINLKADIKGELQKAIANVHLNADNIALTDKINKINYTNQTLKADFTSDFKTFKGDIDNNNFKLNMNGANISCPKLTIKADDKDITISPSNLNINGNSNVNISGNVKNYINNPAFDIKANGKLVTSDLKQLLGADLAPFINAKGALPLNAAVSGDSKKQTIMASIDADSQNYITPVNISNVLNKNTVIKTVIDIKGDKLNIKDSGFFIKNGDKLTEIVTLDGNITKLDTSNPNINMIKIKTMQDLKASLCIFPKSSLLAKGNIFVFGDVAAPKLRGEATVWDMSIPELYIKMNKAAAKLESNDLDVNITNLSANESDYNVVLKADISPSSVFTIKNLNLVSDMTDADKLMQVSDAAMKYFPQTSSGAASSASSSQNSDIIPVCIKDGSIDIKQIKTGTINLYNTTGKLSFLKNIVYINNLITKAFDGTVKGDVSMNIVTSDIKADLKGNDLNVEKTLLDAAAMKDTLTGTMDFSAKIGLRGYEYLEQMKSLTGNVSFNMKNGSLGPFGRIENLIAADNVKGTGAIQSTLGSAIKSLLTFDTSKYNTLDGEMTFANGIANISSIKSKGDVMSAYITGTFNLLNNNADLRLRGKLGSEVTNSMGLLGYLNPANLVNANPSMGFILKGLLLSFNEVVTEEELNQIPALSKEAANTNATMFQAIIRGNVEQPMKVIKSFKWITLKSDLENANNASVGITDSSNITENLGTNLQEIKTDPKGALKNIAKGAMENAVPTEKKQAVKDIKDSINKAKESSEQTKNILKDKEGLKNTLKNNALNILKVPSSTNQQTEATKTTETAQPVQNTEQTEAAQ